MMQVTSRTGWALLVLCIGGISAALVWSVVHRIPERVTGDGLLIPGRTRAVESPVGGVITRIHVRPGQIVEEGEKVLAMTVPNAAQELEILRQELANLERDMATARQEETEAQAARRRSYEEQRRSYLEQLERTRVNIGRETGRLENMARAGAAIRPAEREAVESSLKSLRIQLESLAQNLETLEKGRLDELFGANSEERARQEQLRTKREQIFRKELDVERVLGAEVAGRVFDVIVDEGDTVSPSETLVRIEESEQELQALIYVPSRPGQKVRENDEALVYPANVSREQFGGIRARVSRKADYPSTLAGIINDIRNETLAQAFTRSGAPLRMEIDLILDPQDPSGYSWSGGRGPGIRLIPGTECSATVIVDRKRPLDYVVPLFKEHK